MYTSRIVLVMVLCLAAGLLPVAGARAGEGRSYDKASFYFSPHEDDWQLFMDPPAFEDAVDTHTKTVFIHVTAGDAGKGTGTDGRKQPYYLARENGSRTAIRFMADAGDLPAAQSEAWVELGGHRLFRVGYKGTAAYFLRVPDGSLDGGGYPETGRQSLQRLERGEAAALTAVDGSTVYRGWRDLVATIRAIVDRERGSSPLVQLNFAELDEKLNPGDHPDHRATARAVLEAAKGLPCARRVHYVEYASAGMPENLDSRQRQLETSAFAATVAGLTAFDHWSCWDPHWLSFLGRGYSRTEEGTGRCEAPVSAAR